jgi:hypothetical protein
MAAIFALAFGWSRIITEDPALHQGKQYMPPYEKIRNLSEGAP